MKEKVYYGFISIFLKMLNHFLKCPTEYLAACPVTICLTVILSFCHWPSCHSLIMQWRNHAIVPSCNGAIIPSCHHAMRHHSIMPWAIMPWHHHAIMLCAIAPWALMPWSHHVIMLCPIMPWAIMPLCHNDMGSSCHEPSCHEPSCH
jgi:hypothetical protein